MARSTKESRAAAQAAQEEERRRWKEEHTLKFPTNLLNLVRKPSCVEVIFQTGGDNVRVQFNGYWHYNGKNLLMEHEYQFNLTEQTVDDLQEMEYFLSLVNVHEIIVEEMKLEKETHKRFIEELIYLLNQLDCPLRERFDSNVISTFVQQIEGFTWEENAK